MKNTRKTLALLLAAMLCLTLLPLGALAEEVLVIEEPVIGEAAADADGEELIANIDIGPANPMGSTSDKPFFDFSGPNADANRAKMEIVEERWRRVEGNGVYVPGKDESVSAGEYTVSLTIAAKDGYVFGDSVEVFYGPGASKTVKADDGMLVSADGKQVTLLAFTKITVGEDGSVKSDMGGQPSGEPTGEPGEPSGEPTGEPLPSVTVEIAEDGKTAKAAGPDVSRVFVRIALVLDNNGVSGLYVTQGTINPDGTIVIPSFQVPGLKVTGVSIVLTGVVDDILKPNPQAAASAFRMF